MEAACYFDVGRLPVLTPILKGSEAAVVAGAKEIAAFVSASEPFSKSNVNCRIEESLARDSAVTHAVKELSNPIRRYVSCAPGCPVEGEFHRRKWHMRPKHFMKWAALELLHLNQQLPQHAWTI